MPTTVKKYILSMIIALLILLTTNALADASNDDVIHVAKFSEMDLTAWENKSFEGETQYSLIEQEQTRYLQAKSEQCASALYKKIKININESPYLNWSWRVDQALPELDEKTKKGDDYAARIYVVFKTGISALSAKALNYVWSSNNNPDTYWPNAYTKKAIMIPLRSNLDEAHTWQHEKINIKEDLIKYFGKVPKYIDGIAIMTDADSSQGTASASYGDIYFSKH